ncbi:MAG: MucBP domain-containing protein [Firmicutes bacterium]|nr:MucBP domain-containing protein [Bacillota bacterium]
MKAFIRRCFPQKWRPGLLALVLFAALLGGIVIPYAGGTRAAPALGHMVVFNHPYTPPSPAPTVFGPDMTAWSLYRDTPGYDTAFTEQRSRAYTGDTSPNHIYLGSNTLVFQGYDKDPNLDCIFTGEYGQFSSVSFALRPMDLSFHALSQSGFLFNGKITAGKFSGYMIALEAREDETTGGRCADLRLYHVLGADLDDADAFADLSARTLVSTYALGITESEPWPVYIRVESTPAGFQVFVDGQLRTRDLDPLSLDTGFGFFTGYIAHDCPDLTVIAYSNLRIEAGWVDVPAQATVRFLEYGSNAELAAPQTRSGSTGQTYYITPPDFAGYSLIETNQRLLDPITYFTVAVCNETTLYYVKKEASYKEASYEGVQNNGTAKNPVLVSAPDPGKHTINYSIHAGGDGNEYKGDWEVTNPNQKVLTMSNFPRVSDGQTHAQVNDKIPSSQQKADVCIGYTSTSLDGKMTLESNVRMQVGEVSSSSGQARIPPDGIVVGFQYDAVPSNAPTKFLASGTNAIPYVPPCTTSGANHQHSVPDGTLASNVTTNAGLIRLDERYIKVTYNTLRLDAGYQIDFNLGAWGNAKLNDYFYTIKGRNSAGEPVSVVIYRPSNLWSTNNNGNSINVTPIAAIMPAASEYTDRIDGLPYIYPQEDGTISLTVMRMHNTRHDYNIYMSAGQMQMRARKTVMSVIDYLPPGVSYVPGSSGPYEANLEIKNNPDGSTTLLWWNFGVVPPDGIDIHFQVTIDGDGYFPNHAFIDYSAPCPIPDTPTNTTYHMTGMTAVTEHFLDYGEYLDSGALVNLKGDRTIHLPRGEDYTTSIVSLGEILYKGDTYTYKGYRIVGKGSTIHMEEPPAPTIPGVTDHREIELFFAKNPVVTVEFRYIVGGVEIKAPVDFPVTYGDPFFLPDSAREPIPFGGGQNYNYIAFSDDNGVTVAGMPEKPVFTSVTQDHTVIVYFDLVNAVTVHYVEYLNPANVLQNDDYYLVALNGTFQVAPATPSMLSSMEKRYIYEGYSLPGGPFVPGLAPDFTNVTSDKEITLYYSTTYLITVKWHRGDIPYADGLAYDELLPVSTFTIRAGDPFAMAAVPAIVYGGVTYNSMNAYKWTGDAQPANPGSPSIAAVYGDYTIIFLYEPVSVVTQYTVVVMFREYGNTANVLDADQSFVLSPGDPFNLGAPPPIPGWIYFACEVDRGTIIPGQPPADPIFTNIDANHVIILQYIPQGVVVEQFRELDDIARELAPNRIVKLPSSNIYTPDSWVPPAEIYVDGAHIYLYQGYQINGGPVVYTVHSGTPRPMNGVGPGDTVTYLYKNTALQIVTERFRIWGDTTGIELAQDNGVPVAPGGAFTPGVTPNSTVPPEAFLYEGRIYRYAGYSLNGGAPQPGKAPETPFPQVDGNDNVITYLYRALTLHVRQVILEGGGSQAGVPLMGYLQLANDGLTLPATCNSGPDETPVDYTGYAIPLNTEDLEYLVRLVVPQNYAYRGYISSGDDGEHDSALRVLPGTTPNGRIPLNFNDADELWLTLYIDTSNVTSDHGESYVTNDFGELFPAP